MPPTLVAMLSLDENSGRPFAGFITHRRDLNLSYVGMNTSTSDPPRATMGLSGLGWYNVDVDVDVGVVQPGDSWRFQSKQPPGDPAAAHSERVWARFILTGS